MESRTSALESRTSALLSVAATARRQNHTPHHMGNIKTKCLVCGCGPGWRLPWVLMSICFAHAHFSLPPLHHTHNRSSTTASCLALSPFFTSTMNTNTPSPTAASTASCTSSSSFSPSSSLSPCPSSSSNPQPPAAKRERLCVPAASVPPLLPAAPTPLPAAGAVNHEDPAALCAPLSPYTYTLSSFTLGRRSSSSPPPSLHRSFSVAAVESRRASVRLRESYSFGELAALAAAGGHLDGGAGERGGEGGGGQRKGWGSAADQVAQ